MNHETFNRFASYVFWAFLAFIILSALVAPDIWGYDDLPPNAQESERMTDQFDRERP